MAQANFTPISLYFSTTPSAAPTSGNLVNGELAINITDGKLYFKNNSGAVTLLASAAGAAGDVVGPASSTDNALARFDTTTGKLIQNSVGILSDAGVLTGLTGLTSSGNVTLSALTATRIPYASTGGLLVDSANMTFDGTTLTVAGLSNTGNTTLGNASADTVTVNGTITSNLIFTDNTYDIGASGATRPRSMFLGTNLTVGNNTTVGTASGSEYIYKPGTDTATGVLRIQAGAGSAAYGGGLVLYSHSNATNPGWVVAGLSTGAAAKFAVNTWGIGGGTNVFTVDPTGLGYFAGNVAINTTPAAWTDASALLVSNYAAYGQRNIGNSDGVVSWNAQWSGGASGAGYTYRVTGDVASAYEQNGAHRFYTTPTAGTAGAGISFPVRLAISAAGYTYIGYQGTALANLNILTGGSGGGIQLNRNTSSTNPTIGESFGQYAWKGVDSANTNNAAEAMIEAYAAENHTGSSAATNLAFYTKASGVGPGSAPTLRGGISYAGQWVLGNSVSPDGNAKLTLYTGSGTNEGLSIYETSSGNNARLRIYQASAAAYYDATYSSGGNSHNFQIGSGTTFSVHANVAVVGSASPLSLFGGSALQGPSFLINQVAGVDQTAYVTGAYQPTYVGNWLARGAYRASMYQQASGGHAFFTNGSTPAGAGSTVSFTQALTIDPNSFVGINQASPTTYLEIGGIGEMLRLDGAAGNSRSIYLRNVGAGTATFLTDGTLDLRTNAAREVTLSTNDSVRRTVTSGGNMLTNTGRNSNAWTMGNMQEWVGSVTNIADAASFSLFAINNIYDNLCYELNMFVNTGGFFAYKSAGIFGYNGFTNTVLGSSTSQTITKTGTLYNETMTITNNQGSTVNQYIICVRVWGLSQGQQVSTGGQDCITSSYLTRIQ